MDELQPGALIDERYIVEAEIGRGGMAIVYRVRHAQLGTLAALKLLTMPATSIQKRLMHEGRVQAALQHPNIVSVSDVVVHNNAPGLVMEYVRGPSLDDFLLQRRPTVEQADELAAGILKGVAAAHAHGLIHRDLKPANIMLSITDTGLIPKVTDFGLVKVLEGDSSNSKTRSGVAMGTPSYMAPEQISDAKSVDVRADIFSLGAILYELVSSVRTFDDEDMFKVFSAIVGGNYRPIQEYVPELPERMIAAIDGALIPDRESRIPDVLRLLAVWSGQESADGTKLNENQAPATWGKDFLDDISNMGAGGETTAESLRRSLQGALPTQSPRSVHQTGSTVAPHPSDIAANQRTQSTMAPIPGMLDTLQETQAGPARPDHAPEPEPAPPAKTSSKAMVPLLLIGGLFFVGLMAAGTVGGAMALGMFDDDTPTNVPVDTDPPAPDPVPVPDPTPEPVPTPDPEPTTPEPTTPEPTTPQPVAPTPPPSPVPVAAPQPVPVPVPEPVETPDPVAPVPVAAPVPVDVPDPSPPPKVYVSGGGVTVRFLNSHGTSTIPEKLTAGTYKVVAFFQPQVPTTVGTLSLKNGDSYQVRCSKSQSVCKIKGP